MAKKKIANKPETTQKRSPSLASIRRKIDQLDREIVGQLNQRADLALEIGKLKNSSGQPVYAPHREEEVLGAVARHNPGPLSEQCIRAVFRELISGSRAIEKRMRVAFLGPEYSYSHLASIYRFGKDVDSVAVGTISAVFEEVDNGHADYGLVPIENSTDGRVADTLDMFTKKRVRICAEVNLHIHHHLLGRCGRSEIKCVCSKPQALSQCRQWLTTHLPSARMIEVASTSKAAELARDESGTAAIASAEAGVRYGLNVLAGNIEDNSDNMTRFVVIGQASAARSGNDKTSIMFQIEHQPGTLAEAMVIFKRGKLNLTWIESFPLAGPEGGYLFFIELEGHEQEAKVRRAIAALEKKSVCLEVLGSYAISQPVG